MKKQVLITLASALSFFMMNVLTWAQDCGPERMETFRKFIAQGRLPEAQRLCITSDIFEECVPFQLQCLRQLRTTFEQKHSLVEAQDMAQRVTAFKSASPADQFALGRILVQREKWDQALSAFERAEPDPALWADARYNRLLMLETLNRSTPQERRRLWQELLDKHPDESSYQMGYFFHLASTRDFKNAFTLLKEMRPRPEALSATERQKMDLFFHDVFPFFKRPLNYPLLKRWELWLPKSDVRALHEAQHQLVEQEWSNALRLADKAVNQIAAQPAFQAMLPEALMTKGVAQSYLQDHQGAARTFDECAGADYEPCRGWLAKELAYIGRWDLAQKHWRIAIADGNLSPMRRRQLQRLLDQAKRHRADSMAEDDLPWPSWSRSRF